MVQQAEILRRLIEGDTDIDEIEAAEAVERILMSGPITPTAGMLALGLDTSQVAGVLAMQDAVSWSQYVQTNLRGSMRMEYNMTPGQRYFFEAGRNASTAIDLQGASIERNYSGRGGAYRFRDARGRFISKAAMDDIINP